MPSQLPPAPRGRTSGFPYAILWEEFAEIWERLDDRRDLEGTYETLLASAAARGLGVDREPGREAIKEIIRPLNLPPDSAAELEAKLYRIAAAYRIPQLKIEIGLGASATKSHLTKLATAAARFTKLLENTPVEQQFVLALLRKQVDPTTDKLLFNFEVLVKEVTNLTDAASAMAKEVPQMPRGKSVSVIRARLMDAATRAIGNSADDCLEVLQADSERRNPRPKSTSAKVLFAFLSLVDPKMTNAEKVRLFAGHNHGPKFVSIEEMKGPGPKRWPLHDAREKLTRSTD